MRKMERSPVSLQVRGHGFVGGQHELLDDAVGDVARRAGDAGHPPHSSNSMSGSGRSKSMEPRCMRLRLRIRASSRISSKRADEGGVALAQSGVAFEQQVHVGVGHALGAADDAAAELLRDDVALVVDLEQGGEHQAVPCGIERADVGGELEGQHGHGAVGEVDAGAAQAGLVVDGRCRGARSG